jgi:hypothetical protein
VQALYGPGQALREGEVKMGINQDLKSIERNLLAQQQKAIEENREYMKAKMDNLEKGLEKYLDKRIAEELDKRGIKK